MAELPFLQDPKDILMVCAVYFPGLILLNIGQLVPGVLVVCAGITLHGYFYWTHVRKTPRCGR